MRAIVEPPPDEGERPPPAWKRIAWFAGLAFAGALSAAAIAYVLKILLR